MKEQTLMHNISLGRFKTLFPDSPFLGIGDDFFVMDVQLTERNNPISHPCRFDGFMIIYCVKGHIRLNVNLEEYELHDNMLFMYMPGNLIRVNELVDTRKEDLHYICMAMSKEFVSSLMLDVNKIFTRNMALIENPCLLMDNAEKDLLCGHVNLILDILKSDISYKSESVRSVLSSVIYNLASVWSVHMGEKGAVSQGVTSRSRAMFEQFIRLVSEYHTMYRNVGFYADKLCLTPKYLSRLIKDASGRSAPDWIDAYVILEAKNLLKYSSMAIKEIVFKLNFPNQSVFYKFFKARTGMTPTEYRNS